MRDTTKKVNVSAYKEDYMKPILFNTEMVQAILDGRKTVTRRVIKQQVQQAHWWEYNDDGSVDFMCGASSQNGDGISFGDWVVTAKPPYKVGDVLYVRETWCRLAYVDDGGHTHYDDCQYYYATDGDYQVTLVDDDGYELDDQRMKWRPSIHMPKEAARLFLRVTDVRPERLQDMTQEDAEKEGFCETQDIESRFTSSPLLMFTSLWDSTIKKQDIERYSWDANPWVWVIKFERIDPLGVEGE